MNTSDLGKKIKEARLAKKMTQAEVVGTFITRNMLSQIESGTAMPSVKTLTYLASVLGLPLDLLLGPESEPEAAFSRLQVAKRDLREGRYAAVIDACADCPPAIKDEMYALTAQACLARARELLDADQLEDVTALVRRAIDCAGYGIYANEALQNQAQALLNQQAERLSRYFWSLSSHHET